MRKARRRARRNPGIPVWATAAIAAGISMVTYAGIAAGSFVLSQRLAPTPAGLNNIRYGMCGVAILGGLALAWKKSPAFGVALAGAGAVALAGNALSTKLAALIPAPKPAPAPANTTTTQGVYDMNGAYNMNGAYQMGSLPPGRGGSANDWRNRRAWRAA